MNVPLHLEYREAIAASRVEISGLIGEYLPFLEHHPDGEWVRAQCPFHDDVPGTFFIYGPSGTFACRDEGCQVHGDLIDFVAMYWCISRADVTEMILEMIGL
jgi:DNA primase